MSTKRLPPTSVRTLRCVSIICLTVVCVSIGATAPGCNGNKTRGRMHIGESNALMARPESEQLAFDASNDEDSGTGLGRPENEDFGIDLDSLRADLDYINSQQDQSLRASSEPTMRNGAGPDRPRVDRQPIQWVQPERRTSPDVKEPSESTDSAISVDQSAQGSGTAMQPMQVGDVSVTELAKNDTSASPYDPAIPASITTSELLVMLMSRLSRERAFADNNRMRYDLAMSALSLVDPTRQINPANLYDLSPQERDIVSAYQQHFLDLDSQLGSMSDPQALALTARQLADSLQPQETLRLSDLHLCTAVMNYGNYTEIDAMKFLRGRRQEVIVYVEVDGFTSNFVAMDNLYHTTLTEQVDLYTAADGVLVYSLPAETVYDTCRRTRRDFYLVRRLTIPENLNVGDYRLKVRVRDESNSYEAETVLPFQVVADPALLRASR